MVMDTLQIRREIENEPQLGFPMAFGKNRRAKTRSIIDRVRARVDAWSSRLLSQAGRVVLIKSAAQSIPIYFMSCFKLSVESVGDCDSCTVANLVVSNRGQWRFDVLENMFIEEDGNSIHPLGQDWMPPPLSIFKLNADTGGFSKVGYATEGTILRDSEGVILFSAVANFFGVTSPLLVELMAIQFRLQMVVELQFSSIWVEFDSLVAIQEIHKGHSSLCEWFVVISNILDLALLCSVSSFLFVRRSFNNLAHQLARVPCALGEHIAWLASVLDMVL
ncbi:hypothetical protein PTKIN_Ptkin06aG0094700 [Pterospermum kingtungense]